MEVTPPGRVSAPGLVRGFPVWGGNKSQVTARVTLQLLSLSSFSSLRGQKGEQHSTLIVQCSKVHMRQMCYLCPGNAVQGALGSAHQKSKGTQQGLMCFLGTTELDENVPSTTILYLFSPLQFLSAMTSFSRGAQSSVQEVNCFPLSHIFKLSVLSSPNVFSMFISGKDSRRLEENSIMDFRNYPIPCNTNSVALPALLNHWSFSISVQCNCTFQCLQKIVVAVQGSEKWV